MRTAKATLAYPLINRDGPAIQPGSWTYARSWIRGGAVTSAALLQMGFPSDVRVEFRSRLGDDVQWLAGRAYPYAENIPYFPLIDLLNRSWGIDQNDTPTAMREKLEAAVSALVPNPSDALPVIARLYDLEIAGAPLIDREAFQGRLRDALRRVLTGLASRTPTVICLRDLHWADACTVKMIHELTGDLRIPALLVGDYRPGYDAGSGARVLELSARQTRNLLQSILDGEPAELTRFVEERSDGNLFYVEEVVNSLVETGVLARNGTWRLAGSLAPTPSSPS